MEGWTYRWVASRLRGIPCILLPSDEAGQGYPAPQVEPDSPDTREFCPQASVCLTQDEQGRVNQQRCVATVNPADVRRSEHMRKTKRSKNPSCLLLPVFGVEFGFLCLMITEGKAGFAAFTARFAP